MSNYALFRKKMENDACCRIKYESSFIVEGASATVIHSLRLDRNKDAALVITDKEGPDTAIVYTNKEHTEEDELLKGDYFTWRNNTYFVYENVDIVREVSYKKQKAYQCNVSFEIGGKTYYGYYVSSLAKYVESSLIDDLVIADSSKPVLVMPYYNWIEKNTQIVINGRPWKVDSFDFCTNDKVAYLSLDTDFLAKSEDIDESMLQHNCSGHTVQAGVETQLAINFGYVKFEPEVEVVKQSTDVVVFKVPYGIDELDITIKNDEKIDVTRTFKVVI